MNKMAFMIKLRTVLLIICFLSCKHSFTQSEYYFTRGLAASGIHHYGREALYSDKLAYQLYTNTLKKPVEGEALGINNNKGEAVYWQLITADSANRFRGRGFGGGGGYIYFTYDADKEKTALLNISGNSAVFFN